MVSILNGNISYTCLITGCNVITWTLNGTQLQELNLNNVQNDNINAETGVLVIFDLTERFNNTDIQCRCILRSGALVPSGTSKLNIQGIFYHRIWSILKEGHYKIP